MMATTASSNAAAWSPGRPPRARVRAVATRHRRCLGCSPAHDATAAGSSTCMAATRSRRWVMATRDSSPRSEQQARTLIFQSNAVPLESAQRAATRLTRFAGLGLNTAFFISTGAEANENALKLALKITGRRKVVAIEGSFHGRTAAAGAVTWGAMQKWYGFPQAPFDVEFVPRGDLEAIGRIVDTAHRCRHRRTRAGRWRRDRSRCGIPASAAHALQRGRRAADQRRSAVRHGSHGPSVCGQSLRRSHPT